MSLKNTLLLTSLLLLSCAGNRGPAIPVEYVDVVDTVVYIDPVPVEEIMWDFNNSFSCPYCDSNSCQYAEKPDSIRLTYGNYSLPPKYQWKKSYRITPQELQFTSSDGLDSSYNRRYTVDTTISLSHGVYLDLQLVAMKGGLFHLKGTSFFSGATGNPEYHLTFFYPNEKKRVYSSDNLSFNTTPAVLIELKKRVEALYPKE